MRRTKTQNFETLCVYIGRSSLTKLLKVEMMRYPLAFELTRVTAVTDLRIAFCRISAICTISITAVWLELLIEKAEVLLQ